MHQGSRQTNATGDSRRSDDWQGRDLRGASPSRYGPVNGRVSALLAGCALIAAGCSVGLADTGGDATATDATDAVASDAADAARTDTGNVSPTDTGAEAAAAPCSLLGPGCVNNQACYPYPFDSPSPTDTRCAFQGAGDVAVPCQSQLDCDGTSICSNPGDPSSVCLARCDLSFPYCFAGTNCIALSRFSGVGACTL